MNRAAQLPYPLTIMEKAIKEIEKRIAELEATNAKRIPGHQRMYNSAQINAYKQAIAIIEASEGE